MGANLHEVFVERVIDLQNQSQTLQKSESTTAAQRVWMVPRNWNGNPFDIPGTHLPAFDRTDINNEYEQICGKDGGGNVGDAASLKIQLDAVACMERSFRFRHASHIRNVLHAAARHGGHGHPQGPFGALQNYAQDLISAAGEG